VGGGFGGGAGQRNLGKSWDTHDQMNDRIFQVIVIGKCKRGLAAGGGREKISRSSIHATTIPQ